MKWLVSASSDIIANKEELNARREYIREVTGVTPSPWTRLYNERGKLCFYICTTKDKLKGLFVTGHIGEIVALSNSNTILNKEFMVANTCMWEQLKDKDILYTMMRQNPKIKLWFARQALSVEYQYSLRPVNILSDVGNFGFSTSKSERILFVNRKKGFMSALEKAFDKVSPVILPKDCRKEKI